METGLGRLGSRSRDERPDAVNWLQVGCREESPFSSKVRILREYDAASGGCLVKGGLCDVGPLESHGVVGVRLLKGCNKGGSFPVGGWDITDVDKIAQRLVFAAVVERHAPPLPPM
jgi:hypothetical protein